MGLIANFIPYFLIFVPIEESGICWLYYLTRSPYQLEKIENWLYFSSEAFKYIINSIELLVLLYFLIYKIKKMDAEKIEIAQESRLMILSWFFFSFANMTMQIVSTASQIDDVNVEKAIARSAFAFVFCRNISIAMIAFYYSVIKQIQNYDNQNTNKEDDDKLGMHAIDDFDTAMKSTLPVQYFRQFVNNWTDYSKISESEPLARYCKKYYEIFQLITIYNLMQNKMNHNMEIYERKLKKWKSKTGDRGVEPPAPQIH